VVKGVDAIREVWLQWTAALDEFGVEVEEWIDAGDEFVPNRRRMAGEIGPSGCCGEEVMAPVDAAPSARSRIRR
jgi:hypothetical protein